MIQNPRTPAPVRPETVRLEDTNKILAYGAAMVASWTTVYPRSGQSNANTKTIVTYASYKSLDATDYTLKLRLLDPSGTAIESLPQAQLVETGECWIPFKDSRKLTIEPGWSLQQIISGGTNVAWSIHGYERWLP